MRDSNQIIEYMKTLPKEDLISILLFTKIILILIFFCIWYTIIKNLKISFAIFVFLIIYFKFIY